MVYGSRWGIRRAPPGISFYEVIHNFTSKMALENKSQIHLGNASDRVNSGTKVWVYSPTAQVRSLGNSHVQLPLEVSFQSDGEDWLILGADNLPIDCFGPFCKDKAVGKFSGLFCSEECRRWYIHLDWQAVINMRHRLLNGVKDTFIVSW